MVPLLLPRLLVLTRPMLAPLPLPLLVLVSVLMPLLLPLTLAPLLPALVLLPMLVPEPPAPLLVLAVRLPSRSGRLRSLPTGTSVAALALLLGPGATPPAALKDAVVSGEAAWTRAW